MSADQKWGVFVAGCGVVILAIEGLIRLARWVMARVDRNVERMVDDGLAALAVTDDDFAEYADPDPYDWSADALHAWADRTTPTFRDLCANSPAAVDALAAAEASRADWDVPARWTK